MRLTRLPDVEFNVDLTLNCGQVFHWDRAGKGYLGAVGRQPVYVEQRGRRAYVNAEAAKPAKSYFGLDHSLEEIYLSFPRDRAMIKALEACRGMRIIRQPIWECLATFITSAMKQVAHIRQISHTLRRRYGERLEWEYEIFSYPDPHRLARLKEEDLRECALGFRAGNLLKTARMIAEGKADLESWRNLETPALREKLCEFPGVGEKIANCVLLFAYERLEAVPIDVWIAQVLRVLYFKGDETVRLSDLTAFSAKYFGEYSGYAQQYLFHHARVTFRRSKKLVTLADWTE